MKSSLVLRIKFQTTWFKFLHIDFWNRKKEADTDLLEIIITAKMILKAFYPVDNTTS